MTQLVLPPDLRAALEEYLDRERLTAKGAVITMTVMLLLPFVIGGLLALFSQGWREQYLGRSEREQVTVLSAEERTVFWSSCARGSNDALVHVRTDGGRELEHVHCDEPWPQEGDRITVWVTPSGKVFGDPPSTSWGILGFFAVVSGCFGALLCLVRYRHTRRVRALLSAGLGPSVPTRGTRSKEPSAKFTFVWREEGRRRSRTAALDQSIIRVYPGAAPPGTELDGVLWSQQGVLSRRSLLYCFAGDDGSQTWFVRN